MLPVTGINIPLNGTPRMARTAAASGKRPFYNKSLERALKILCSFDFGKQEQTLTELAHTLGLPKSTAHRLVSTLTDYHFLQYDQASQRYCLGLRIFGLGSVADHSLSLKRIVAPFLTELHARLNKTVALAVLRDDELVYIDKREDWRHPVKSTEMGRHRPPHFGMFGQLLMAFLPEEEVDRILKKSPLVAYTKRTIAKQAEFKARLRAIRKQGYVIDDGQVFDGVTGIAAPIKDSPGKVVGGIGVSLITAAEDKAGVKKIIKELVETTEAVSEHLKAQTTGAPNRSA
jgi:IclR family transcriptional regulator, KDG regulon repressor